MKHLISAFIVLTVLASCALALAADAGPDKSPTEAEKAQPAPAGPAVQAEDAGSALGNIYGALRGGQWLVAFGLALLVLIRITRPMAAKAIGWFDTRWGGYTYAGIMAIALSVGTALAANQPISLELLMSAAGAVWLAIGAHTSAKDVAAAVKK